MTGTRHLRLVAIAILATLAVALAPVITGVSVEGNDGQALAFPGKSELKPESTEGMQ